MSGGVEAFEVIACGLRPEGSWMHLVVLVGFVLLAWRVGATRARSSSVDPIPPKRFFDIQSIP